MSVPYSASQTFWGFLLINNFLYYFFFTGKLAFSVGLIDQVGQFKLETPLKFNICSTYNITSGAFNLTNESKWI